MRDNVKIISYLKTHLKLLYIVKVELHLFLYNKINSLVSFHQTSDQLDHTNDLWGWVWRHSEAVEWDEPTVSEWRSVWYTLVRVFSLCPGLGHWGWSWCLLTPTHLCETIQTHDPGPLYILWIAFIYIYIYISV